MKEEKNIQQLLEMLDHPEAYTEQEIRDIINQDEETREVYRMMVEAKRSSRHTHANNLSNVDAAWERFNQKRNKQRQPSQHWWIRVAAIFIAAAFLCGLSYAAYHSISSRKSAEEMADSLAAAKEKLVRISNDGNLFIVNWPRGTWVVGTDGDSFKEERLVRHSPFLDAKTTTVKINGKAYDIHELTEQSAAIVKKVELDLHSKTINLITTPVQIPANVKGNINPEMTILLTGTPPKDSGTKTTIWIRHDNYDGFSWKNYSFTSWKWNVDNISHYLEEIAYRKDHHVRVNICKGVPQQHIDRIKKLMQEKGVTNYELVKQ